MSGLLTLALGQRVAMRLHFGHQSGDLRLEHLGLFPQPLLLGLVIQSPPPPVGNLSKHLQQVWPFSLQHATADSYADGKCWGLNLVKCLDPSKEARA